MSDPFKEGQSPLARARQRIAELEAENERLRDDEAEASMRLAVRNGEVERLRGELGNERIVSSVVGQDNRDNIKRAEQAERERDEARAEAARLREELLKEREASRGANNE